MSLELKVFQQIEKAVIENVTEEEVPSDSESYGIYIHARIGALYQQYICLKDSMNRYGLNIYVVEEEKGK